MGSCQDIGQGPSDGRPGRPTKLPCWSRTTDERPLRRSQGLVRPAHPSGCNRSTASTLACVHRGHHIGRSPRPALPLHLCRVTRVPDPDMTPSACPQAAFGFQLSAVSFWGSRGAAERWSWRANGIHGQVAQHPTTPRRPLTHIVVEGQCTELLLDSRVARLRNDLDHHVDIIGRPHRDSSG